MSPATALLVGLSVVLGAARQTPGGSVTIAADPAQCAKATSVQIWSIRFGGGTPQIGPRETMGIRTGLRTDGGLIRQSVTFVDGQVAGPTCKWTFRDLPSGAYVALLVRPDGSGGSHQFTVSAPAEITVSLLPPTVTLSGVIVRNGAAVPGVPIHMTALPFSRPAVVSFTDRDGRFTVLLDRPGLHEISLALSGRPSLEVETTLDVGTNRVTIDISTDPVTIVRDQEAR